MRATCISGMIVTTAMVLGVDSSFAQRGGFGPESIMERLDENGNGRLDPDEISQSRMPIGDMAERAGLDPRRGLDAEDVARIFETMQRMRESGEDFGRGGFGRGGRGDSDGGFGRGGSGRGGFGDRGFDRSGRGGDRSGDTKGKEPPPRVTVDLQALYLPGDIDGDGQIAMAEWIKWKSRSALADFLSLDRNADGILTPRELARAGQNDPVDVTTILPGINPAALPGITSGTVAATPEASRVPASSPSIVSTPDSDGAGPSGTPDEEKAPVTDSADVERHTATAQRFFKILDRDRDGNITDLEWQRSSRLRPKFEAAGANLSQPMAEQQFIEYYVKFSTSGGNS